MTISLLIVVAWFVIFEICQWRGLQSRNKLDMNNDKQQLLQKMQVSFNHENVSPKVSQKVLNQSKDIH